jgi:hypothetical protein
MKRSASQEGDWVIPYCQAFALLRQHTGVAIPIYVPPGLDRATAKALLWDTVSAFHQQVEDPAHVCLSVDGEPFGADIAAHIARKLGVQLCVAQTNRGKLHGARIGVRRLLDQPELQYVAVVDQDGDHFANELINMVRAAESIRLQVSSDRVLILGQRTSRHRPMGLLRGELEELADRVLLDALRYHAAVTDRPLSLAFASTAVDVPDFHSGYKLFSRPTASAVFLGEPQLVGVSPDCYWRHACEAVMTVEALLSGAQLGVVARSTFNQQPVSTFGLYDRQQLTADMIIWPCKRLGVPVAFVRQWLCDHIPYLLLETLVPTGREELAQVRHLVLADFGDNAECLPPLARPLFV